ncbi:MAG: hypothetical protein Q9199_008116, partial [Rusavskia elegans]
SIIVWSLLAATVFHSLPSGPAVIDPFDVLSPDQTVLAIRGSLDICAMQIINSDHDAQTRLLSESWNEQAGPQFDLTILVLAVVNVTAACGIILTIFYDAHVLAKFRSLSAKPYTSSSLGISRRVVDINPAEILPLALSIAITVQGIVYIIHYGSFPTPRLSSAPRLRLDPSKATAFHAKGGATCSFASWQYWLLSS